MKIYLLVLSVFFITSALQAQNAMATVDKEAEYAKVITERAAKIVKKIGVTDAAKEARVTKMVADQYCSLNRVYTERDEQVKAVKLKMVADKEALSKTVKAIEEATASAVTQLHESYLLKLATEIPEDQIVKVKDGMTYGVLPITYSGYLDMLPDLTGEQKEQIMKWLVEAREYAMRAESSEKKHWWFGKYKGRINNYLSAAGYDLKKESEAWHKRIEERKQARSN